MRAASATELLSSIEQTWVGVVWEGKKSFINLLRKKRKKTFHAKVFPLKWELSCQWTMIVVLTWDLWWVSRIWSLLRVQKGEKSQKFTWKSFWSLSRELPSTNAFYGKALLVITSIHIQLEQKEGSTRKSKCSRSLLMTCQWSKNRRLELLMNAIKFQRLPRKARVRELCRKSIIEVNLKRLFWIYLIASFTLKWAERCFHGVKLD